MSDELQATKATPEATQLVAIAHFDNSDWFGYRAKFDKTRPRPRRPQPHRERF